MFSFISFAADAALLLTIIHHINCFTRKTPELIRQGFLLLAFGVTIHIALNFPIVGSEFDYPLLQSLADSVTPIGILLVVWFDRRVPRGLSLVLKR